MKKVRPSGSPAAAMPEATAASVAATLASFLGQPPRMTIGPRYPAPRTASSAALTAAVTEAAGEA
jgi:hypothetical protein